MEKTVVCSNCGTVNSTEARFCGHCGQALAASVLEQPAAQAQASASPPSPTTSAVSAARVTPAAADYAGFWSRLVAFVINNLVLGLVIFILALAGSVDAALGVLGGAGVVVAVLGGPAYFWLFPGLRGQTPGKRALAIRVVDAFGDVPGLGRGALRELLAKSILYLLIVGPLLFLLGFFILLSLEACEVSDGGLCERDDWIEVVRGFGAFWSILITLPVGLLAFLWIAWDHRKQGWHDKLAGTYVVKARRSQT